MSDPGKTILSCNTLFLDRDGVINKELPGNYVKTTGEFEFEKGALEALHILSEFFERILIVTNQRGIGIGVMSEDDLRIIHANMMEEISNHGGRIDGIYHAPDSDRSSEGRKPHPAMGHRAKSDFPEIDFKLSVIAGNSESDIQFGKSLGMQTVFIDDKSGFINQPPPYSAELNFPSLHSFALWLKEKRN